MLQRALISALVVVSVLLAGCATVPHGATLVDSPADLPSIQQEKAELLSKLKIGMPLSEFKQLVPEAYVGGQSGETTAYELKEVQKYVTQSDIDRQNFWVGAGSPNARTSRQVLWFYFPDSRRSSAGRRVI